MDEVSSHPHPHPAPLAFLSFSCSKLILMLFFRNRTPLHLSALDGNLEFCRLLLQCNADIDAKDGT
jgi:hypothetical protein